MSFQMRVALIYDDELRPETTGLYCLRAIGQLVAEVKHVRPHELGELRPDAFDLFLAIDDGLDYILPSDLRPSAYWAIDTHLNFPRTLVRAKNIDFVFAAQKNGAAALQDQGYGDTVWLPLACDPELHVPWSVPKSYDITFIGNFFPGPRTDLVRLLQQHFPNTFVGRAYFEEMAKIYSATRMAFNRSIRDDINMRLFETLSCGAFLLTNGLAENGQEDLFKDGVHLATYQDIEELLDKARYYLRRDSLRERIAAAGREEAVSRHTYRHRMETLLTMIQSAIARTTILVTKCRADDTPSSREFVDSDGLLDLIPPNAHRVLDVGCGDGRQGSSIKIRQRAEVVGIEVDPAMAELACAQLDQVHVGDVEQLALDFADDCFDAIICNDVLAHIRDPLTMLRRLRSWIHPQGCLVAGIPNIRNFTVLECLLRGDWSCEWGGQSRGMQLHFFTRREIEKLCFRAGLNIRHLSSVHKVDDRVATDEDGERYLSGYRLSPITMADREVWSTDRYALVAVAQPKRPAATAELQFAVPESYPLTSIVIVTHNGLHYTRQCLQSIWQRTDEPYELIIVDNGSTDGTVEYVQTLSNVTLVANSENRGFPAAANQGMRSACGQQVLLLNNDCLVTTGWLRRLLTALYRSPQVGLVGPVSNCVSGPQQIEVAYNSLAALDGWAWEFAKAQSGKCDSSDRLVGFCLLLRRELVDAIGYLDERFGIGNFEDDDYCRRALQAGYQAMIVRDAFVHHFGGRTFQQTGIDFHQLMRRNAALYREKWSETQSSQPSPPWPNSTCSIALESAPGGGLLLPAASRVQLSLCMIVRDSAFTLRAALESVRPWVDEMVVVDTGSQDATPQIAAELGARVFHFPWCDDFSAARNESLRHARGEWIFWMDSDDTIDETNGRQLRELVRQSAPVERLGYVIQVHCPGHADGSLRDLTVVDHVKLFRNRPELRFEGRIHEQVLPAIRRLGGQVSWTELFVVHSGADLSPQGEARKLARDLRLLELELAEHPEHPFALFNLGMTYAAMDRHEDAVEALAQASRISHPSDSHVRKIYALWVSSLMQLGRFDHAWEVCQQGRACLHDDPELAFREGMLAHHFGWLPQAERAYKEALQGPKQRHFSSVDPGIYGHKARHNLAMVYLDLGQAADAEREWRLVLLELPAYREGWRGLGDALLRQGKLSELELEAHELVRQGILATEGWLILALLARHRGAYDSALELVDRAAADSATAIPALRLRCHLLFDHGAPIVARAALQDLSQLEPTDAAVHHNLGLLALRLDAPHDAVAAFHESLRLRPRSPHTHLYLGVALDRLGLASDARRALEEAHRLAPHDDAIRATLESLPAP